MNGTTAAIAQARELWSSRHQFCSDETAPASLTEARFVMTTHAGHGPRCLQYWAAVAYSGGAGDGEDV